MAVIVEQSMSWFWASVASCVLCVPLVLYLAMSRFFPRRLNLLGAHVLITGGSSGIGLACAKQCVRRGAHVTLVARDMKRLERAREEVKSAAREVDAQHVLILSCDMLSDFDTILASFDRAVHEVGPVDVLINCAGISSSTAFDESSIETFEKLMRLNYLTAVYATRAVLTSMKDRNNGRIVFTSSQAGQLGLYGYTAYSASKFALRGFAEALQMEVKPYNVFITLAFPPDTDTPGYAEELKSLSPETKEISETSGVFEADYVAKRMVDSLVSGSFFCFIGLDGFLLGNLTAGMAPVTSVLEVFIQCSTMSFFRLIGLFYLTSFDGICSKWKKMKNQRPKKD